MANEPHRLLEQVDGPESFLEFVDSLVADRIASGGDSSATLGHGATAAWENTTIESFLESAAAWARDSQFGQAQGLGTANPWRVFATFLYCGKIYE